MKLIDWIEELPTQTLTDELKMDIIERIQSELDDVYKLVHWPESQDYMDEDWFSLEAISDTTSPHGTYLIPLHRVGDTG